MLPVFKEKIKKVSLSDRLAIMKSNREEGNKINELCEDWKDIMFELGMYTNSFNTYTLINIEKKTYGYKCNIYATKGLVLDDLEKAKPAIETGIGCMFLYNVRKKGSKTAEAKFITEGFGGDNVKFIPPKTSPFEICLGNSVEGKPVIISAKDVSHFLLSGANGTGKSRLLDIILTTLIYNCDETQLELYLAQIAKNDLVVYEDALCCRAFCETLDEVEIMLTHIMKKMAHRTALIKPMRKDFMGSDITDYNKLHPNKKMTVCWVVFDEISSIMENTGNDKAVAAQKKKIISMIEEISKVGRALGIWLGVCLQRCTANMLSPLVKSQTNLRISFAQNNIKSSEVATDDPNVAIGLDDRVAVYSCRARGFDYVKTPYMDDKVIEKYILAKCKRGHRNLFTDLKKQNTKKQNTEPDIKVPDDVLKDLGLKFTRSEPKQPPPKPKPVKTNGLAANILDTDFACYMTKPVKKVVEIPNYVPYNPPDETIVKKEVIPPPIVKEPREHSKVAIKTENEILLESIKKIKDFIPYIPPPEVSINVTKNTDNKGR